MEMWRCGDVDVDVHANVNVDVTGEERSET